MVDRVGYDAKYYKKHIARVTAAKLKKKYGITKEQWDEMFIDQDGLCWICGVEMKPPQVDHDHGTKEVRGLLCKQCNHGLGMFKDNVASLRKAIEYLERPREKEKNI